MSEVPRWRRWGRRVSFWVLLGGILLMVMQILQGYPVVVEVVYHFGAAREGLLGAVMTYRSEDGEQLRRVKFRYGSQPASTTQNHAVKLPRGNYRVAIELEYRAAPPRALGGGRVDNRRRRIDRPLIVTGEGQVSIYLE